MKLFTSNLILIGINLLLIKFMKCEEPKVVYDFPENFKFGAASAAYQIEGAWNVDGKTPSIWDTFTHEHPEFITDHSTGDMSDDSYHFYQKDIEALKEIGVRQQNLIKLRCDSFSLKSFIIIDSQFHGPEFSSMVQF